MQQQMARRVIHENQEPALTSVQQEIDIAYDIPEEFPDGTKLADYLSPEPTAEMSALLKIQKLQHADAVKAEEERLKQQEKSDHDKLFGNPELLRDAERAVEDAFLSILIDYYEIHEEYLKQLTRGEIQALAERVFLEKSWIKKTVKKFWGRMVAGVLFLSSAFIMSITGPRTSEESMVMLIMLGIPSSIVAIHLFFLGTLSTWLSFRKNLKFLRKYRGTHYFPPLNP